MSTTPDRTPDPTPDDELGGDPVCWAHLLCPQCGAMPDSPDETRCARCGADFQSDEH